jgi:hypothetical protein
MCCRKIEPSKMQRPAARFRGGPWAGAQECRDDCVDSRIVTTGDWKRMQRLRPDGIVVTEVDRGTSQTFFSDRVSVHASLILQDTLRFAASLCNKPSCVFDGINARWR